ncbi:endonuclease/exonuclease/phosphatase family protein [Streptomyces sp. P38-E01]|uniref:Endonuclease/exonuclease/phosphatase family protein n=1 Tax=Streptomyces tardus TaxID=2780544 RepID=A0A949N7V7_9ACTN|nr:endonuclease/exonuclease/phosphatase family protein [Streptomyces tardus]MBU7600517.1 endonuclease/exonuclease/phosphatase family protein [Streptomyces tardus]
MYTGESQHRSRYAPDRVAPSPARPAARSRRGRRSFAAWLAVLLLIPGTVPAVARAMDVDGPTPVPQLLAFLPWFLAPGWLALLAAVVARRFLLVAWSLALLGTTAWFLQPYGSGQTVPSREPSAQIRVLTANLRFGEAMDAFLEALRSHRPHLVSVQECDSGCARTLRSAEVRRTYPHQVITGNEPAEGSAVLSVYPLAAGARVPGELSMPSAVADVAGIDVRFQVAHPMPPMPDSMDSWRRELGALRAMASGRGETSTIMAGDFNASQDHAAFRAIVDTGMRDSARLLGRSRTPTWPVPFSPPLGAQIDHVLVSEGLTPVDAQFFELSGSDHQALLVDVRLY